MQLYNLSKIYLGTLILSILFLYLDDLLNFEFCFTS